jgi:hypothetical protein
MEVDQGNCTFLQGLSPELQKKIQTISSRLSLPTWPEECRGVPNICLRSALFGVIQRGRRKAVKRQSIAAINGLYISYTGWRLDQGDFDVLAHSLHLASRQATGNSVQFSAKGFIKGINRSHGKSGREWLKDSLRRLTASAVEIQLKMPVTYGPEFFSYTGSLLEEFFYTEEDQTYFLKFNSKLATLFDAGWTQLQWQQRLHLRTALAKWLHGFYASHRIPYPMKVATLQQLCGSDCARLSDYRGKLRIALAELVEVEILANWLIDQDDKVHVHKPSFPPLDILPKGPKCHQGGGHSGRKGGA